MTTVSTEKYGSVRSLPVSYDEAVSRTRAALQNEGWGVLSEIDVSRTFKEKLGVDFPKYLILGACNPQLAKQALEVEQLIGLLMPCNVVIQERDGKVSVAVASAKDIVSVTGNDKVNAIAKEADVQLKRALEAI